MLHIRTSSLWLVFEEITYNVICSMQVFNFNCPVLFVFLFVLCIQEIPLYPEVTEMYFSQSFKFYVVFFSLSGSNCFEWCQIVIQFLISLLV